MKRNELVDYYLEKKLNDGYDFSMIKEELKEKHELSGSELSEIVDLIANAELSHTKFNLNKSHGFILFTIVLGVIAIVYSIYGISMSFKAEAVKMSSLSQTLNYLCLLGGVYVVFRNVKKLRG